MSWLVLSCGHQLLTDEREEEGNLTTSEYCPECGLWNQIKQVTP